MSPSFSHQSIYKTVVVALVAALAYLIGDFMILYNVSRQWKLPDGRDDSFYVILFADPQIQGYFGEYSGIIGHITRWDADRYLKNTFLLALGFVNPDVVVFLGDLLDEGCTASDEEFIEYKDRFKSLFYVPYDIPTIYLAGDNDICGEQRDILTSHTAGRFSKHFGPINDVINIKSFQFVKLNTVSFLRFSVPAYKKEIPVYNRTIAFIHGIKSRLRDDSTVILLTHTPLPYLPSTLSRKFLSQIKPKVSLAGHLHKHKQIYHRGSHHQYPSFWEHILPTCSYRMGTLHIGAGVLIIDKDGSSSLTILKFPERYYYLYVYLIFCCVLFSLYILSFRKIRRKLGSCVKNIVCFPCILLQQNN